MSRVIQVIAVALAGSLAGCGQRPPVATPDAASATFSITRAADRPTFKGGDGHFTGSPKVAMLFTPNGPRDFSAATVAFAPGERTAWHSHPAGQTLVVTEGTGWVQIDGGDKQVMRPGDVVWTPPGVRHWHGATGEAAMTHIALQSAVAGEVVQWFERVDDATYTR